MQFDVGLGNVAGSAWCDDDRVITRVFLDENVRRARKAVVVDDDLRGDACTRPGRARHFGKGIVSEPADEVNATAGLCSRDGLVRTFPARPERKAVSQDRFAHLRLPVSSIGGVGDEHAEYDDLARHGHAPPSSSGGMTPLRNMKHP